MEAKINTGEFNGKIPYVESYKKGLYDIDEEMQWSIDEGFIEIIELKQKEYDLIKEMYDRCEESDVMYNEHLKGIEKFYR